MRWVSFGCGIYITAVGIFAALFVSGDTTGENVAVKLVATTLAMAGAWVAGWELAENGS